MPPSADAVAGQANLTLDPSVAEGIIGEVVDVRSPCPGPASVDGRAVDVPVDLVGLDHFPAGLANDHGPRLVAGVAVQVGNIVVPDYDADLEGHVAIWMLFRHPAVHQARQVGQLPHLMQCQECMQ